VRLLAALTTVADEQRRGVGHLRHRSSCSGLGSVRILGEYDQMLVPVLVFLACMSAGAVVGSRWTPDLAAGQVGGLAFFIVCGLLGAALGLVGLHVYLMIEQLEGFRGSAVLHGEIVAAGIRDILFEAGSVLGFAVVIYLLAPPPEDADIPVEGVDSE
jgi:hypothetical protein